MQFPVPQFTDVEDKIIGPLTLKQFGILFGTGMIVFLIYSLFKSLPVLIVCAIFFGIPALGLAFAPFNGRPMYNGIPKFVQFVTSQKVLVFHKEAVYLNPNAKIKDAQVSSTAQPATAQPVLSTKDNLKKVEDLLNSTASQEKDIAGKIKY